MEPTVNPILNQDPHQLSWAELKEYIAAVSLQMQETDKQVQETSRQMQETRCMFQETDKRIEASRIETDKRIEASRLETDRRMQETSREVREMRRTFRESLQRMEKTDKKLKNLNDQFVSQTGHILEGLTQRSALRALQKAGFRVEQSFKEMTGSNSELGLNMEIDLLYVDTTEAIAVEVKTNCTKAKINHFLKQMRNFKLLYPHFADLEVYAAIAALNITKEAEAYAREKGLIVIHVSDDVFTIDPIDRAKLKRF
ncbi:MAG: hypothetical protein MJZ52_05400 [Bacteroidales bacterium]|nr:hypothetical protein [Bacteroidales bacterium]